MTQKIALVTGASRGLGAALALDLATRGWQVVAVARTVGGLEELDDRLKALALPEAGALTLAPMTLVEDDAIRQLCRSIHDRWGRIDLWAQAAIHAAPLTPAGSIELKDWDKSVALNVRATGVMIPMVEPLLRASDSGTALFLDDPQAGKPFLGAYGATKAAQIALARSWQAETRRIGPRVMIAEPQPMATATRGRFYPGEEKSGLAKPADEARRILDAL